MGNKLQEKGQGFDLSRFSKGPHQSMNEKQGFVSTFDIISSSFALWSFHWLPTWPLSLKKIEDLNVPLHLNSLHHLNLIDIISWSRDSPHCWLAIPMYDEILLHSGPNSTLNRLASWLRTSADFSNTLKTPHKPRDCFPWFCNSLGLIFRLDYLRSDLTLPSST